MRIIGPDLHRLWYPHLWLPLDGGQVQRATNLGRARHTSSEKQHLTDFLGDPSLDASVQGALGEFGAAMWLHAPEPDSVNAFGEADLLGIYGVRTRTKWHYELFVRPHESARFYYILTTWVPPCVVIRGWLVGAEVKKYPLVDWGNKNRPAHVAPLTRLEEPDDL